MHSSIVIQATVPYEWFLVIIMAKMRPKLADYAGADMAITCVQPDKTVDLPHQVLSSGVDQYQCIEST